jgi:hypothetical protein
MKNLRLLLEAASMELSNPIILNYLANSTAKFEDEQAVLTDTKTLFNLSAIVLWLSEIENYKASIESSIPENIKLKLINKDDYLLATKKEYKNYNLWPPTS